MYVRDGESHSLGSLALVSSGDSDDEKDDGKYDSDCRHHHHETTTVTDVKLKSLTRIGRNSHFF